MEIAKMRFLEAISRFVTEAKQRHPERIFLNLGGDFFNTDSNGKTTTKGTPQDEESTVQDTNRRAAWMMIDAVNALASVAPVTLIIIPGNHDEIRSWFFGHAMEMRFYNDKRVTVDNREVFRKYYRYGINLLGAVHGEEDAKKLPFLMIQENLKDYGETRVRYVFKGHYHKKAGEVKTLVDEDRGVTIWTNPSLSGSDKWHNKAGWIGAIKEAQCWVFDRALGHVETIISQFF
jgi:hypothetical protein